MEHSNIRKTIEGTHLPTPILVKYFSNIYMHRIKHTK